MIFGYVVPCKKSKNRNYLQKSCLAVAERHDIVAHKERLHALSYFYRAFYASKVDCIDTGNRIDPTVSSNNNTLYSFLLFIFLLVYGL